MKAKVFKYKSDGNTVVASYMELEPYAKNVYLSLSRKNEDGNEDDVQKLVHFPEIFPRWGAVGNDHLV